jgi:hypothetical protein
LPSTQSEDLVLGPDRPGAAAEPAAVLALDLDGGVSSAPAGRPLRNCAHQRWVAVRYSFWKANGGCARRGRGLASGLSGSTWSPLSSHIFFGAFFGSAAHMWPTLLVLTLKSYRPWMRKKAALVPAASFSKSRSAQNGASASW